MLDRDAGMRPLVVHGCDDRGLRIAPARGADAGDAAQRRLGAVGGGDQPHCNPPPVGEGGGRGGGRAFDRAHSERREQREARQRMRMRDQGAAQHPILDDPAERCIAAELAVVVMQEQGRVVVGDADLEDRLCLGRDRRPQAEHLQHLLRAIGDRRAAPVEVLVEHRCRVLAVDDGAGEPGAAAGDAEQQPIQPAAGNQQFAIAVSHPVRCRRPPFLAMRGRAKRLSEDLRHRQVRLGSAFLHNLGNVVADAADIDHMDPSLGCQVAIVKHCRRSSVVIRRSQEIGAADPLHVPLAGCDPSVRGRRRGGRLRRRLGGGYGSRRRARRLLLGVSRRTKDEQHHQDPFHRRFPLILDRSKQPRARLADLIGGPELRAAPRRAAPATPPTAAPIAAPRPALPPIAPNKAPPAAPRAAPLKGPAVTAWQGGAPKPGGGGR